MTMTVQSAVAVLITVPLRKTTAVSDKYNKDIRYLVRVR